MTVSLQTLIDRSVRNMGAVHPAVKKNAIEVLKRAYKEGITAQISDGLRTFSEQTALYAKGRTAPGNVVTNARAGQSYHNFGLAIDYFLTSDDGDKSLWNVNSDWIKVAAIAKSLGFEWGGDWNSFVDYPHLQMSDGLSLSQLRAGRRPDLGGSYNPPSNDNVLENGDHGQAIEDLQKTLIDLGYKLPKYGADSDFGDETEKAVRAFQADQNIKVDGIVGPKTKLELKEAQKENGIVATIQDTLNDRYDFNIAVDNIPGKETLKALIQGYQTECNVQYGESLVVDGIWGDETKGATLTVKKGVRGNITWIIQARLICLGYNVNGLDSIFGNGLEAAIKRFQADQNIYVDGQVGKVTFEHLFA